MSTDPTPERDLLIATLRGQRRHVEGILEDLDDEAWRRPVLPSGWTCLGLVRHLALDDERFWFGGVVAGDQEVREEVAAGGWDAWHPVAEDTPASVLDLYRAQCARADEILATTSLDAAPGWWPSEQFGDWRMQTVRAVLLHVITETAVHAGHLDAARELLDGRRWMVLED